MSSILSFVVAVLVRSDIQTRVQEQLGAVTGRERLPTFEDRPRLPFVEAVCKEVLRWRPVTPLGEYHRVLVRVRFHDLQLYPTQPLMITSTRVFLYPRVCWFGVCRFPHLDQSVSRCADHRECIVRRLSYSFQASLQLLIGRSFMTRSCFQNRIPSHQSGSSILMEVCVTILSWHQRLGLESVSALDDTLFIVVASLLSVFNIEKGKDSGSDGYPYMGTGIT